MLGGAWPLPAPLPPPLVVTLQTSRNFLWVWSGVDEPTPEQKFQRTQLYLNTKILFFSSLACTIRVVISSYHFISMDMFFLHEDESVLGTRILLVPSYFISADMFFPHKDRKCSWYQDTFIFTFGPEISASSC